MKVKTILVSQPEPSNEKSPYARLKEKYKLKIDFRPFIHVEGMTAKDVRQQKINFSDFNNIILTSKNSVDHFFKSLEIIFQKFENESFLIPTSDILNSQISSFLDSININWTRAQLYKTVVSDLSDLRDVYYDILVFFSPSGIESLFKNFPDFKQNKTRIAVYGDATDKAASEAKLRIDIKAPTPDTPSMTMAIEKYISQNNK